MISKLRDDYGEFGDVIFGIIVIVGLKDAYKLILFIADPIIWVFKFAITR